MLLHINCVYVRLRARKPVAAFRQENTMSMCPKFSAQMNAKASSTILLLVLVLVGCHAISAHGTPYVLSFFQKEYPAALHNLLLLHV
jgi:hypothetical protein